MRPNTGNIIPAGYFEANPCSPQSAGLAHWWPLIGFYATPAALRAIPAEGGCIATSSVAYTIKSFTGGSAVASDIRRPVAANTDPFASAWGYVGSGVDFSNKRPFTISLWVLNLGGNNRFVFSVGSVSSSMQNLSIMFVTSTSVRFGWNAFDVDVTVPSAYGRWVHLAMSYDPGSNTVYGYCDGLQVGAKSVDAGGHTGNTTFCIGNYAVPSAGSGVWGAVCDTRVYYRRLHPSEIWNLYAPATRWQLFASPLALRRPNIAISAGARFAGGDFFIGGW